MNEGIDATSSPTIGTDRRAYRRARLDAPVLLETPYKTVTARSVDISAGGISIKTDLMLTIGQRVSVYFELPIRYGVETQAEVIRREGDMFVLRFHEPTAQDVLAIRSFCRVSGVVPAVRSTSSPMPEAAPARR